MKYKSTLTVALGFVVLFVVAYLTFPKLNDKPKSTVAFSKMEVKTKHREKGPCPETEKKIIPVRFSLNASFSPEPKNEQ